MDAQPPRACHSAEWCLPDFPIWLLEVCQKQESKRSFSGHWSIHVSIEPRVFSDEDFFQSEVSEQPKKNVRSTDGPKPKRNCKSTCPYRRRQQRTVRLPVVSGTTWHPIVAKRRRKEQALLIPITESINSRREGRSAWW
jgi:hypothetical protein